MSHYFQLELVAGRFTKGHSGRVIVAGPDGAELDKRYRAILAFAVGTGLRPEEWIRWSGATSTGTLG